jgi:cellulose synthase (UDP-forming)
VLRNRAPGPEHVYHAADSAAGRFVERANPRLGLFTRPVDADVMSTVTAHSEDRVEVTTEPRVAPLAGVPELPASAIAPSSPMAVAARRFGDDYPPIERQWVIRGAALAYVLATLVYLPWLFAAVNRHLPWLAWPFLAANVLTGATTLLSAFNHWRRRVPDPRPLSHGDEPTVGIIIPCCGEPVPMILRTVVSVLEQDWPRDRMIIVVSDDGHDPNLEEALQGWPVVYHSPPDRYAPGRDGAPKSGNLNSAAAWLLRRHPEVRYVETRDCDDEVASLRFLRHAVGQLEHDGRLAYVQTIKETQVSAGDPFNNRESMFYRGQMLSRNAANAVFPCGSGLVWRRTALENIGLFPTWNLVEDLQSGVEALRRGWHSCYLPIVGAMGQHSPEDMPNVYKQRGTWAIDTVRLMLWGELAGLGLRQRLQFYELLLYYLHSFTLFVYVPCICLSLLGYPPFVAGNVSFLVHILPLALATEAWLLAINRPYNDRRRKQRHPIRELWRVRTIWSGLAPVFIKASVQAILGGPNRKPVYRVTRKHTDARWHWGHTLPQAGILLLVVVAGVFALRHGTIPRPIVFCPFLYWGGLYVILFANFVARSWHGVSRAAAPTIERRRPGPEAESQPCWSAWDRAGLRRPEPLPVYGPAGAPLAGPPLLLSGR